MDGLEVGDEGAEYLDVGVEGRRLSADWERLGRAAPGVGDVRPALGEGHLRGAVVVDEAADLYLDEISRKRGLRAAVTALFFSDGTNGGRGGSSFCSTTDPSRTKLLTSIHNFFQIKPH